MTNPSATLAAPHEARARSPWLSVLRLEYQLDNLLVWFTASALAATQASFHLGWFCAGLVMLVLAQAALELLDGYWDFVQGAHAAKRDGDPVWSGGSGVLAAGALAPSAVKRAAWCCGLAATALFAVVTAGRTGVPGLVVGAAGAIAGAGWAMPPLKLSYRGVGEVVQGVVMGPLMATQAWVVATGHFDARALWVGVPFGALELAMGLLNNFVDRERDAQAGKRTWVVRRGAAAGARAHAAALGLAFVALGGLLLAGVLPWPFVACGLAAPLAARAARETLEAIHAPQRLPALAASFPTYRVVGAFGAAAVVAALAWRFQAEPELSTQLGVLFIGVAGPLWLLARWARP